MSSKRKPKPAPPYAWRESAPRQESELDSLKAKMAILIAEVDAVRKDIEEARRVQMELDCKAICIQCDQGVPVSESKAGIKYHAVSQSNNPECAASEIRREFEKEHPDVVP